MTALPKASELARIQSATGFDYRLTPADAVWTLRMAVFESAMANSDPTAVLWAMAQRFVLLKSRGNTKYATFHAMLRDFSQPLNPRWRAAGEFCRPGGKYHGTASCSADKLARRELAQHATLAQLYARAPTTVHLATEWLRGRVQNPVPRATDFAQEPVAAGFLERNPGAEVVRKEPANGCPVCNVLIATTATQGWPEDQVWMAGSDGSRALASGVELGTTSARFASSFWGAVTEWWRG